MMTGVYTKQALGLAVTIGLFTTSASFGITLGSTMAQDIEACLSQGKAGTICEYPQDWRNHNAPLVVDRNITWSTPATLQFISKEDIIFDQNAFIIAKGAGSLTLKAGMENEKNRNHEHIAQGKIIFNDASQPHILMREGAVQFYYNPEKGKKGEWDEKNKYWNNLSPFYEQLITFHSKKDFTAYMLVNHVRDLQDIRKALYNNYALSYDIDATETKMWDQGKGFRPLKADKGQHGQPFSGDFDGNGYAISSLYINRPDEDKVGLFGMTGGFDSKPAQIKNILLKSPEIIGDHYVGGLVGFSVKTILSNVTISAPSIKAKAVAGGIVGTSHRVMADKITLQNFNLSKIHAQEYKGLICGTSTDSNYYMAGAESLFPYVYWKDKLSIDALGTFDDVSRIYFCLKNEDK